MWAVDQCRDYLSSLLQYVKDFHQRTQPLGNLKRIEERVTADFEARFESGSIPGWEEKGEGSEATRAAQQLDLDAFDSTEELLALGMSPCVRHCTCKSFHPPVSSAT